MIEIVITALIVGAAAYILYGKFKKKSSGGCDCGGCTSKCPLYKDKTKDS